MIFLSPLLLSISSNLYSLTFFLSYGIKKIRLTKSSTLLLAVLTSISLFISMYVGKLILHLFTPQLGNIFGGTLLSFIGVYFIVEYIRLKRKHAGFDTSYYFESFSKHKNILENPDVLDSDESYNINIKECLNLSIYIIWNNLSIYFASSITGISISLSIFFNFIVTLLSVYLVHFNSIIYITKWFKEYSNLISGIILIILGMYETLI